MTSDDQPASDNAFDHGKPDTSARTRAEALIESLRTEGGVFVAAVRATRMPMVVTDPALPDNPIVFANQAFLELTGYSMDEVLGQEPYFMNGAETDPRHAAMFRDALVEDRDEMIETVQYRKDGSRFVASVFVSAFKDDKGNTRHQFLSYLDVTRRVTAEEALTSGRVREAGLRDNEARSRALAQASSEVRFRMSPDWTEMRELQGGGLFSDEVTPARDWLVRYVPSEAQEDVTAAVASAIQSRGMFELEHRVCRTDGSTGWTLSRAVPIFGRSGNVVEWYGAATDITRRKMAESALRLAESQQAFMLALSDTLRPLLSPSAIMDAATRLLGLELKVSRASYFEVAGDDYVIKAEFVDGVRRHMGRYPIAAFGRRRMQADRSGQTVVSNDIWNDDTYLEADRQGFAGIDVVSYIAVPLVKDGVMIGGLSVHCCAPRHWTPDEVHLVEETAERTWAAVERARADAVSLESQTRFKTLALGISQLVWCARNNGDWTWASPQWTQFTGQTAADSLGSGWLGPVHPDDRSTTLQAWEKASETGHFISEHRIREGDTGIYRYFQTRATPVRDEAGDILEWLGTSTDIQNLRELQDRQSILVAELQHRTRNLLAVVSSIFIRTRKSSVSTDELALAFEDRLVALARVQGLLSRLNEGERIAFDALIRGELHALGVIDAAGQGDQVSLQGQSGILLRSSTVQTFALALHELATNATKYGAFAQQGGRLSVTWHLQQGEGSPRLKIIWSETGVHNQVDDTGKGYGRELIERALPYQLGAETHYMLKEDGLVCTIELPVSELGQEKAA